MPSLLHYHLLLVPPSATFENRSHPKSSPLEQDDYHASFEALNSKCQTPRKSLGQHYMLNSSINEHLPGTADVRDDDVVLEIGAGTGSLTNVLLDDGATVLAIEKDPNMAELVRERFAGTDCLQINIQRFHLRENYSCLERKIFICKKDKQ